MRTNNQIYLLREINIDYWYKKNQYFTDQSLHDSTKIHLGIMQGKGFLKDYNPKSNHEIVCDIESSIFQYRTGNRDKLLFIFDLIQCWGGKMGKGPYVRVDRTTGAIYRNTAEYWVSNYEAGVQEGITIDEALNHLCNIPMVGVSFATKHLMFWHRAPIFDTRMQLLMFGGIAPRRFNDFRDGIRELAAHWKVEDILVERGLFAFSENFFSNDRLTFKGLVEDQTDLSVAKSLAAQD